MSRDRNAERNERGKRHPKKRKRVGKDYETSEGSSIYRYPAQLRFSSTVDQGRQNGGRFISCSWLWHGCLGGGWAGRQHDER